MFWLPLGESWTWTSHACVDGVTILVAIFAANFSEALPPWMLSPLTKCREEGLSNFHTLRLGDAAKIFFSAYFLQFKRQWRVKAANVEAF